MQSLHEIVRRAAEQVLEWCALLEIEPGSVKIVFWSNLLNGEVTNSGCAEADLRLLAKIDYGGKSPPWKILVPIP